MPRFEPVDHDPFAPRPMALMPVDNDPFMVSPEDAFAYGKGISPDATWRNLLPAAELGLSMAPGSGEAMSARDAWDASGRAGAALERGEYGNAMSEYMATLLASLGVIPGMGLVARGSKRGAAWMDRNLPSAFNKALDAVYPSDPRSTTNIFAGPTAKTADHAALAKAQEMKAQGASRADIWRETGWDLEKADQIPRFEIDDSSMAVNVPKNQWSGEYGSYKKAIDHPELYDAYPPMQRNRVTFDHRESDSSIFTDKPSENAWDRKQYDTDIGVQGRVRSDRTQSKPGQIREQTVHELQHNVQGREGFAPGSGPETIYQAALDAGNPISPEEAIDIYRRLAGEVEARNVATRLNMTAAERRATPPWETQDVPDDMQIVRFGGNNRAMSTGPERKFDFSNPGTGGARQAKIGDTTIDYGVGRDGLLELTLIKTPKAKRGQGSGRAALRQFLKEADEAGLRVGLNADPMDKGVSKSGLENFYKSEGFYRNSGKKKDFSTRHEYLREPK